MFFALYKEIDSYRPEGLLQTQGEGEREEGGTGLLGIEARTGLLGTIPAARCLTHWCCCTWSINRKWGRFQFLHRKTELNHALLKGIAC